MNFLGENSLVSTIITLYVVVLLYFPSLFLQFIFSPVVLSAVILLLFLLRLGAARKSTIERSESDSTEFDSVQSLITQQIHEFVDGDHNCDSGGYTGAELELRSGSEPDPKRDSRPFYVDSFVEWDVRAPLEVIYEEYEGEDAEENDSEARRESQMHIIRKYASLSLFYPESDSDASSEGDFPADGGWDSPGKTCFRWEEEDDREGLIEIALDEKRSGEVDEENLIEIDLSPAR